jgi:hypothetical protein
VALFIHKTKTALAAFVNKKETAVDVFSFKGPIKINLKYDE